MWKKKRAQMEWKEKEERISGLKCWNRRQMKRKEVESKLEMMRSGSES